jgi:hypothetical protein
MRVVHSVPLFVAFEQSFINELKPHGTIDDVRVARSTHAINRQYVQAGRYQHPSHYERSE